MRSSSIVAAFVVVCVYAAPANAQFFRSSSSCPGGNCGVSSSYSAGFSSSGYSSFSNQYSPMIAAPSMFSAMPGVSGVGSYYVAPGPVIQSTPWGQSRSHGSVRFRMRERW